MKRFLNDVEPGEASPLDHAMVQRDKDALNMVRDALAHRQTLLAYQPVVHAGNKGTIAFYEGLIRVLDATGRIIPARDFMGAIETTETGRDIDVQTLRMGLSALKDHPQLRLSLNMSARSIGYQPWIQLLHRSLNGAPGIGERLILEISEASAMTIPELVAPFMDDMQPYGVCFAMDDFGSGQTAIRYFSDFYFDIVKIDGQFVRGIAQSPDNRAVTEALIAVARSFDMLTVAGFVENAKDAAILTRMGVDCLQGHHFGAPTTRPEWLEHGRSKIAG